MRRFSEQDIQFLKDNYAKRSNTFIGKKLGRSAQSVSDKARKLGLRKDFELQRSMSWTNREINYLIGNYRRLNIMQLMFNLKMGRKKIEAKMNELDLNP